MRMHAPPLSVWARHRAKIKEDPVRYQAYREREQLLRRRKRDQMREECAKMESKQFKIENSGQEIKLEKEVSHNNSVDRMNVSVIHIIQSMATRIPVIKLRRVDEIQEQLVPEMKNLVDESDINLRQSFSKDCETCEISFCSKSSFDSHLQECVKVNSKTPSVYSKLFEQVDPRNDFTAYIQPIIAMFKKICPVCSVRFKSMDKMLQHLYSHETDTAAYYCALCNATYTQIHEYVKHVKQHKKKIFQCKICSETFVFLKKAKRHIGEHLGKKRFDCHLCDKKYKTRSHLKEHVATHLGYKPFQCDLCQQSFYVLHRLNSHKRNMH